MALPRLSRAHLKRYRRPSPLHVVDPLETTIRKNVTSAVKHTALKLVEQEVEPFTEYADRPLDFCRDVLGIELWEKQEKIMLSVLVNPRTAVPACYASGKTYLAAAICLWWLFTRRPALVVSTAPTNRQVKKLLWRYIRKLHRNAKVRLGGKLLQTELILSDDWQGFGFAGSSGTSVQGIHESENVLFVEDEAAGMSAELLEDFEGITAGENSRHLKIGNPIVNEGAFWAACEDPKESKNWEVIPISAFDVPNVKEKRTVIKGLVDHEWVEVRRHRYGENSPFWVTKVLGKFWSQAAELVVPVEWVQAAFARWDSPELLAWEEENLHRFQVEIAADIGRTIDETVITKRHGRRLWVLEVCALKDLTLVCDRIEHWAMKERAEVVRVDATGLGVGVPDMMIRRILDGDSPLDEDIVIDAVVLGRRPQDKEAFEFALDELQWMMRRAFDPTNPEAMAINDEDLGKELSFRSWELSRKGKIKVDTKKDLKKKKKGSPNRADAGMLHFKPLLATELLAA